MHRCAAMSIQSIWYATINSQSHCLLHRTSTLTDQLAIVLPAEQKNSSTWACTGGYAGKVLSCLQSRKIEKVTHSTLKNENVCIHHSLQRYELFHCVHYRVHADAAVTASLPSSHFHTLVQPTARLPSGWYRGRSNSLLCFLHCAPTHSFAK